MILYSGRVEASGSNKLNYSICVMGKVSYSNKLFLFLYSGMLEVSYNNIPK